jgi:hypothetical protein
LAGLITQLMGIHGPSLINRESWTQFESALTSSACGGLCATPLSLRGRQRKAPWFLGQGAFAFKRYQKP